MRLIIEKNYDELSRWAANYVAARINEAKPTPEHPFVLGCPPEARPSECTATLSSFTRQARCRLPMW